LKVYLLNDKQKQQQHITQHLLLVLTSSYQRSKVRFNSITTVSYKMTLRSAFISLFCIASASAFTPLHLTQQSRPTTSLNSLEGVQKSIASFAASVTILSNVFIALPTPSANAIYFDYGSTELIAARSGGRAGGRSSSYRAPPAQRSSTLSRPDPVVIRETRIITPSYSGGTTVMMPPPMYMAPAQPSFPGLGLVAGYSAINAIGEGMREARQENEIRDARAAVTEARIKEAELEARLKSLEQQNNRQYVPQQPMVQYAQPPPVQYAQPATVAP
jgi:hypothetical protein